MRGFQKKCEKPPFLVILAKFGSILVKMDQKGAIFEFLGKKWKRNPFFLIFKTKNQKIPMCGFGENLTDGNERQTQRERRGRI